MAPRELLSALSSLVSMPSTRVWPTEARRVAKARVRARERSAWSLEYEYHRAAFHNDLATLEKINGWTEAKWFETDARGLTVLHVAVLRGHKDAVACLLGKGCPRGVRDAFGWTPLDHALASRPEMVALLRPSQPLSDAARQSLSLMPDCRIKTRLEFKSAWFETTKFNDTLSLMKKGSRIRADGTLGFIGGPRFLLLCDETGATCVDGFRREAFDAQIPADDGVPARQRLVFRSFRTTKRRRTIAGVRATLLEMRCDVSCGRALRCSTKPVDECAWEEYLGGYRNDGALHDHCQGPPSPLFLAKACAAFCEDKPKPPCERLTIKCWFAPLSFPLRLDDALPFLRAAATRHHRITKVLLFIEKYLLNDANVNGRFPVKIELPLSSDVKAVFTLVSFAKLNKNETLDFTLPTDVQLIHPPA